MCEPLSWAEWLILGFIILWAAFLVAAWLWLAWATWCDCIWPRIKARRDMAHLRRQRGVRR